MYTCHTCPWLTTVLLLLLLDGRVLMLCAAGVNHAFYSAAVLVYLLSVLCVVFRRKNTYRYVHERPKK